MTSVDGTASNRALIANNFITLSGTVSASAYYCRFSDYIDIYHNTFNVTNTHVLSEALYHDNGIDNRIQNNIFVNTGGGYAAYIKTPAAIDTCDRNWTI